MSNKLKHYEGNFIVIYNDDKEIENIFIEPTSISTKFSGFVCETYTELVDFIYYNKLHESNFKKYNWTYNEIRMPDFKSTIYKKDD